MTVLLITALIVFVIVTYQIITKLDEVMEYKFNYRFFTKKSLGISTFIYILVKNVRNTDSIWGVLLTFLTSSLLKKSIKQYLINPMVKVF